MIKSDSYSMDAGSVMGEIIVRQNNEIDRLKLSHQRYEKLRKLNPAQFKNLWDHNIETGIGFDQLIDEMVI